MLLGPAITAVGAFFGDSEPTDCPLDPSTSTEMDRRAGLDRQPWTHTRDMSFTGAISGNGFEGRPDHEGESDISLLEPGARDTTAQVGTQFETDTNYQDLGWLERNYYETNWAPAICFWSCLQISFVGIFLVTPLFTTSPLIKLIVLWVWTLFGQPAVVFAIILINVAGEEFVGARKWLNHVAICHGLPFGFCLLGALSLVVSVTGIGIIPSLYGLFGFGLLCISCMLGILVYEALMFFIAR